MRMTEYIILGMLLGNSLSGYDLKKCIDSGVGVFVKTSYGSLYPALKKLVARGDIALTEESGGRGKKTYTICDQGREAFMAWLVEPANATHGVNSHLVRVYFFDRIPRETAGRLLMEYEISNRNYLQKLEKLEKEFQGLADPAPHYYKLSTLYFGILMLRDIIGWCEHIRGGGELSALLERGAHR